ncbi:MAG: hypothetical protein HW391_688 [Chloroflexi bacterium]|nr:hypothetical protein [Chloroflexota bacterium]
MPSSPTRSSTHCPSIALREARRAISWSCSWHRVHDDPFRNVGRQDLTGHVDLTAVERAAAGLGRGLLLLIDYGHPATALYDRRRGSLLRAYVNHRVHDDPFRNVGRQDLTAHVDLTAVERAAADAGLVHLGTTTQAEFLASLGAGDLLVALQTDGQTDLEAYLEARSALFRMLDPGVTGRFAVLAFGRGLAAEPPLAGLAFRGPRMVD